MFRRALGPQASRILARTSSSARCYTNYEHVKYPVDTQALACILGYFFVMWVLMARMGSLFSWRSEYKRDYLRVWRRKLGKGYKWSDEWGPKMDTVWKNVPDRVE
ncbi:hypothetical protein C3747_40g893c [Trypanosoma cruzi]|uniref:Uncharacterized protein n=3 Tax=Trypanosoma cruzi TaxID=5693 RepID=Q4DYS0_TRYCC|nr:hypothetical protein, conserved [Trypanosoma cruzi]ESS68075.1 hypothetical protein TCDM_14300 [Trypanosoma cruzi Dm28c]PBJ75655.1 hypothetical protein BCY84_10813 [Trypanosoma cruzi cruzi]EAN97661.1 hypothetical protein, conserved [Trypanosoma cruzi]KAF8288051.1 hypothetical protein TcBrA4_0016810 [Trypanosoma cruzi]PWU90774.1 hypothetical protein C4B63_48g693c [Trypanosoma cruzi]|eukprot:XP_819512.1 hypothetical protein [Trypanosoma cruzi strain CL Brener]